jgi:hypothetical protein
MKLPKCFSREKSEQVWGLTPALIPNKVENGEPSVALSCAHAAITRAAHCPTSGAMLAVSDWEPGTKGSSRGG